MENPTKSEVNSGNWRVLRTLQKEFEMKSSEHMIEAIELSQKCGDEPNESLNIIKTRASTMRHAANMVGAKLIDYIGAVVRDKDGTELKQGDKIRIHYSESSPRTGWVGRLTGELAHNQPGWIVDFQELDSELMSGIPSYIIEKIGTPGESQEDVAAKD